MAEHEDGTDMDSKSNDKNKGADDELISSTEDAEQNEIDLDRALDYIEDKDNSSTAEESAKEAGSRNERTGVDSVILPNEENNDKENGLDVERNKSSASEEMKEQKENEGELQSSIKTTNDNKSMEKEKDNVIDDNVSNRTEASDNISTYTEEQKVDLDKNPCEDDVDVEKGYLEKSIGKAGKETPNAGMDTADKEKEPIRFCKFIAEKPCVAFGIALGGHILLTLVTGILFVSGYDILPTNFKAVPLDLTNDDHFLRGEAWNNKDDDPTIHSKLVSGTVLQKQAFKYQAIELMYEIPNGNVFTKATLEKIAEVEQSIFDLPNFGDYCLAASDGSCKKASSIIRFFDGSYSALSVSLNDPTFENIPAALNFANTSDHTKSGLQYHLGKEANVDIATNAASSAITRSVIYLGWPLDGYDNFEDRQTEQTDKIENFLMDTVRAKLYELIDTGVGDADFIFNCRILYTEDLNSQVILDMMLAGGSFTFIFGFMCFQTKSLFISGFAIMSILTSFLGANMIYRIVLDYAYFGIFHVLSVFIILGIGADDIFVFYDTWRASELGNYPTLAHRLSDCYKKAAKAMFITSLTTMCAFFASALSPLLAVSSFGLFSGILVFVNYCSVVIFFPTVVAVYHVKYEHWTWPCCRPCTSAKITPSESKKNLVEEIKTKNIIVTFFEEKYFRFVTHKIIRWVIMVFFTGLLGFFIYYATLLKPDEESVKIYKEDTNYGKANLKRLNAFKPSSEDDIIHVYLVWGLKNQDRSMCHKTDFENCTGTTVWDNGFDLNPAPAQKAIKELCHRLRTLSNEENENLHIRRDTVTNQLEIQCFVENMDTFLQDESTTLNALNVPKYPTGTNLSLPTTSERITTIMQANPHVYDLSKKSDTFYRYFEVALSYWLSNRYSGAPSSDYETFYSLIGEADDSVDTQEIGTTGYYYATRLRYAAIMINTTLPYGNIGYEFGLPVVDAWETFFNDELKKMPPSVQGGFMCTPEKSNSWHWLKVQEVLSKSAIQGIIIGISIAFPVLVLATNNIIIGFIATVSISCITVTIVGLIPLVGWKLGVLESLNLSLVVGLAVDYVVHLAEGYHNSPKVDRLGRTQDMLRDVGISVISGSITTLGASLFMLFAKILFFMQFGLFMFGTIGFAMLYALGFFTTLMGILGPQGNVGSIQPLKTWIWNLFTGRSKKDVKCTHCKGKGFHNPDVK
ncbi:unnamed protein product [Owenia fusiformis]|uniref:Uncharacterized protein n=1 Tax=Owenia fusiformis TaxID=6347 RepID=A0A8J1U366_OWEFU|nr:unnamed protein product [Owenia fusiformis]